MAGMGKRMRPHTLTIPKPLIPIAGIPIVQRLAEEITKVSKSKIDEIGFIIGDFGKDVEEKLLQIAQNLGAKGIIYYQKEALGTGHAIYCAEPSLRGKTIVAFADTLFKADFNLDEDTSSVIWTKQVDNPEAFGVVKKDVNGYITDFIEKPETFVSAEAIIGIYYFKEGETLKDELKYLIDNDIRGNNEYQLTDALENMKNKSIKFKSATVNEWLDCGNKDATVYTNQRLLHHFDKKKLISSNSKIIDSKIIEPSYIADNVTIENSVIGPYTTIHNGTKIVNSIVKNTVIQQDTIIENQNIENSMIGNNVKISSKADDLSIGDFTTIFK